MTKKPNGDAALGPYADSEARYERCCLCGKLTDVSMLELVQLRKRYVQGVGQLCAECCWEVYHTDDLR